MRLSRLAVAAVLFQTLGSPSSAQELPEALQPTFEEGVRALRAGKLDAAEAAFQRVLEQGGRVAYVHNNLGLVYQERGQHKPAVAQFREAIRLDPAMAPRAGRWGRASGPRAGWGGHGHARSRRRGCSRALAREQLARAYDRAGRTRAPSSSTAP